MAWIESHTVLMRHRKVVQLSLKLGITEAHAVGCLHALWHTVLEQQEDGDISEWTDEFLASIMQLKKDGLREALISVGWLDNGLIHDWIDYAGHYLTRKYSSSNPSLLKLIWSIHGRQYGTIIRRKKDSEQKVNRKRPFSDLKVNLPNQPNQPNLTLRRQKYSSKEEDRISTLS